MRCLVQINEEERGGRGTGIRARSNKMVVWCAGVTRRGGLVQPLDDKVSQMAELGRGRVATKDLVACEGLLVEGGRLARQMSQCRGTANDEATSKMETPRSLERADRRRERRESQRGSLYVSPGSAERNGPLVVLTGSSTRIQGDSEQRGGQRGPVVCAQGPGEGEVAADGTKDRGGRSRQKGPSLAFAMANGGLLSN